MAKVLLVDDEEGLRLMMGRQLRRGGHEVTQAEDGLAALELLKTETFDLVVSDMKMPRLDGMGLLARAKEITPDTEFIILTGHGNLENAVEAFKAGNVFDYMLKPLNDIQELNIVVDRAIERRSLRSENGRLVTELEARVQELEEARQKLTMLAERDGLTGLYNYRTIHACLAEFFRAEPEAVVAVVMMDMDGFKRLNDTYGHPVGDQALRHLANLLRQACDETAAIGRCGGDEFMIVLPNTTSAEAKNVAENIRYELAHHPFLNPEGTALPLPLCFGIADSAGCDGQWGNLIASADAALYEGKQQGGNVVTLHMVDVEAEQENATHSAFSILDSLVTAIDAKDHYTRTHSEDVTNHALRLVGALGCSDKIFDIVRVAGLLHDVGKIGVPTSILRKPGKLTDQEYEVMKSHVTLSALIIHGLPHLSDILDAVAYHHERWDGNGYPKGLKGEEIPFLGRVMAIADAFSAMTLDRPYRAGMSVEAALQQIEAGAGTQFDPTLAKAFLEEMRSEAHQPLRKAA
jgi:diguanylate cyclase (GGDEF)-like protein